MINDAILQILLLLAYLAIGLISVTIPIYAICVTYLRQEKREAEKERRQRIEMLKEEISELTEELSGERKDSERFEHIKERMKDCRVELKRCERRVKFLTARGAVRDPVIFLSVGILSTAIGLVFLNSGIELYVLYVLICGVGSAFCCGLAFYYLYETISAVEHAALRPSRTVDFVSAFKSTGTMRREIKIEREEDVMIGVVTSEEDLEKVVVYIFVPPEIKVTGAPEDSRITTQPVRGDHANYSMISCRRDFQPKDTYFGVGLTLLANKIGKYRIPLEIHAKGIKGQKAHLMVDVVNAKAKKK